MVRPKQRQKWEEEDLKKAIEQVKLGKMSLRVAGEHFSVPKSTIERRLKSLNEGREVQMKPSLGNLKAFPRTFNDEQERILHDHVKNLDSQLMPLNKTEFLKLAYQFADKLKIKHRFNKTKNMAGKNFYYDFMTRHADLRLRTAESTSLQRAAGFNKEQVDRFYRMLTDLMVKYNFGPSKIFNADETGVSSVHTNRLKVMSVKGKKQVGRLTSAERGRNVTILLSINATGDVFVPPLFVFPRVRMDNDLKKDAPAGSIFDGQPSGWITKDGFLKWLNLFVERVNPTEKEPVLLILDGHASHKDLEVITFAKDHHIHMLSLPPHTSHRLQPLDRTVMKPFKNAYHEACSLWMRQYPNIKISLRDVAGLVGTAFSKICRMELAKSGFTCTGIFPLNPNVFSDLDFAPSTNNSLDAADLDVFNNPPSSGPSSSMPLPVPSPTRILPGPTMTPEPSPARPLPESSPAMSLPDPPSTEPIIEPLTISIDESQNSGKSQCQNLLQSISPLPSSSSTRYVSRHSRGEKSEILTSTPFKRQLEVKKTEKEEKQNLAQSRRLLREEKLKNKKKMVNIAKGKKVRPICGRKKKTNTTTKKQPIADDARKKLKFDDPKTETNQAPTKQITSETEEVTYCLVCGESFDEDWIQCSECLGWSHENCANIEDSLFYKCDGCNVKN